MQQCKKAVILKCNVIGFSIAVQACRIAYEGINAPVFKIEMMQEYWR